VLNRGEKTVFTFSQGAGPVAVVSDNWVKPSECFAKFSDWPPPGETLPAEQRKAHLAWARTQTGRRASPVGVDPAAFDQAGAAMFREQPPTKAAHTFDLDADGKPDFIRAPFAQWTDEPMTFYRDDATNLGQLVASPIGMTHRVRDAGIKGFPRPFLRYELRYPDEPWPNFGLLYETNGGVQWVRGWASKTIYTAFSRATVDQSGLVTLSRPGSDRRARSWSTHLRLQTF